MPAFVLSPLTTFAEALSRCKSLGVLKRRVALSGSVRGDGLRDVGAQRAEVETMAHWLEREHRKRGDLFTARSLWIFRPGAASRARD